jgi:hypothetical protein
LWVKLSLTRRGCRGPIPDPGRGGWNPCGDSNRQLFPTTPSSTSSRPPLLIRGGEFKSPGSQDPE